MVVHAVVMHGCGSRRITISSGPFLTAWKVWGQRYVRLCLKKIKKRKIRQSFCVSVFLLTSFLDSFPLFVLVESPADAAWFVLECPQFKWTFCCALLRRHPGDHPCFRHLSKLKHREELVRPGSYPGRVWPSQATANCSVSCYVIQGECSEPSGLTLPKRDVL